VSSPVASLAAALAGHVSAIRQAAAASPAGGGTAWDELLRHYGIVATDPAERALAVRQLGLVRGATPGEVRMAMLGASRWARAELDRLARDPSIAADPELPRLAEHITGLADAETRAYDAWLGIPPPRRPAPPPEAPAGPSVASIFKNAQDTSKEVPWAGMQYKSVTTLTCVHCGGPQEEPSDFMCRYCRRPIAGTINPNT
jgi:hypothetical protein